MSQNIRYWNSPFWDFVNDVDRTQRPASFATTLPAYESDYSATMGGGSHHEKEDLLDHDDGEYIHATPPPPPMEVDDPPIAAPPHSPSPPPPPPRHRRSREDREGREEGPEDGPQGHHGPRGPHERRHPHGRHHHEHGGLGGRGRGGPWGWGRGRGGCRGMGGGRPPWARGPGGMPFDMSGLANMFGNVVFGEGFPFNQEGAERGEGDSQAFRPDVDVFDTEAAFIVHVALPGAKKQDIGLSWDAEKSELTVAGVVTRPGDEEFLKTLALDERKVGEFDRKVRLGGPNAPARVDADRISAKLEDGVLMVSVPKESKNSVEVRKISIN